MSQGRRGPWKYDLDSGCQWSFRDARCLFIGKSRLAYMKLIGYSQKWNHILFWLCGRSFTSHKKSVPVLHHHHLVLGYSSKTGYLNLGLHLGVFAASYAVHSFSFLLVISFSWKDFLCLVTGNNMCLGFSPSILSTPLVFFL